jgi:hypothetical protein
MTTKSFTKTELNSMSKVQLIELAQSVGVETKGLLKKQLVSVLLNPDTTDGGISGEQLSSPAAVQPATVQSVAVGQPPAVVLPAQEESDVKVWQYKLELEKMKQDYQIRQEQAQAQAAREQREYAREQRE